MRFVLVTALVLVGATQAAAQDLEPCAYVNTPVGMNFLVAGYVFTTGGVALDSSIPLEDAEIDIHGEVLAYASSFGWLGRCTAKIGSCSRVHAVYAFHRAVWAAFDVTYYVGGETIVDGVQNDDELSSVRVGGTLSLALSRRNSIKLYASGAGMTRYGSDFTTVGIAVQHRWGGGI
jgi:hypothetical protein